MMLSIVEPTVRDAHHEVEAVLDHYLNHKNTPPFVAYRMIQRLVSSNPSPRYIKVVATAFKEGRYEGFGTGKRGDMAATIAAVLLDREARSTTLLHDPAHGQLREPLIKVLHILRAMEYKPGPQHSVIDLRGVDFGQQSYQAPSVFNYYLPEYQPSGPISLASLVSPESQLLTAPYVVSFINGAISLIKWGLSDCYSGFTLIDGYVCSTAKLSVPWEYWAGNLSYIPSSDLQTTDEIVSEMDVLLTGGRLNSQGHNLIKYAYDMELDGTGSWHDGLQAAQKMFIMAPEFHATNANTLTDEDRSTSDDDDSTNDDISSTEVPYKAVVYLFLDGAMDSFNLLVPYSDCNGTDLYDEYVEVRENVALAQSDLLPIDVPNGTQPCNKFGIHSTMEVLESAYNDGDALFFANIGPLVGPLNKEEYEAGTKEYPANLFSHNKQLLATQTVHAQDLTTAKGVVGRVMDSLTDGGYTTGSYSIFGNTRLLDPQTSDNYDVIHRTSGVTKLDASETSSDTMSLISNLTAYVSESIFAEHWAQQFLSTKERTKTLYDALDGVELEQDFAADDTVIGTQFEQVAYLMKANQETLHNDRDAFYLRLGGFDTHSDLTTTLEELLGDVNDALTSFKQEIELQGLWNNVTIVVASEFGRTLTSNGLGTDHGWGGNAFIMGGSVKGGQILGDYPTDLTDDGPLNIGRGRLIPTTSWEAVWNAVALWLDVEESTMATVLPHLENFDYSNEIFNCHEVFTNCANTSTPSPTSPPIPAPSPSPFLSPTTLPIPSPTSIPIPFPIPAPTLIPTHSPTLEPTGHPSPVPSTADTVAVSVSFDLTSTAVPTSSDESALLTTIVSELGVSSSAIRGFSVSYSAVTSSRRSLLVTTYLWTTTFEIVVSLAETTSTSVVELTSSIETSLTSSTFTDSVETDIGAVVDTSTVIGSFLTESPTFIPTTLRQNSSSSSSSSIFSATLGAIVIGVIVVIIGIGCVVRYQIKKTNPDKMNHDDDENNNEVPPRSVTKGDDVTFTEVPTKPVELEMPKSTPKLGLTL
jgi:cullin-associated NEDD8-dissociated protein 1